jgi:hypothetical protein
VQVIVVVSVLLCTPAVAASQTLNMSVDLVRLGIAGRNLTPDDPSLDARPLFEASGPMTRYPQGCAVRW